jgi:hypothetical protein
VLSYDSELALYLVQYDDGDQEEMDEEGIRLYLLPEPSSSSSIPVPSMEEASADVETHTDADAFSPIKTRKTKAAQKQREGATQVVLCGFDDRMGAASTIAVAGDDSIDFIAIIAKAKAAGVLTAM